MTLLAPMIVPMSPLASVPSRMSEKALAMVPPLLLQVPVGLPTINVSPALIVPWLSKFIGVIVSELPPAPSMTPWLMIVPLPSSTASDAVWVTVSPLPRVSVPPSCTASVPPRSSGVLSSSWLPAKASSPLSAISAALSVPVSATARVPRPIAAVPTTWSVPPTSSVSPASIVRAPTTLLASAAIVARVLSALAMIALSNPAGTEPVSQLGAVFQSALTVPFQLMICPLPKGAMSVPPAPSGANWKSSRLV
jgi:hypothetical protein